MHKYKTNRKACTESHVSRETSHQVVSASKGYLWIPCISFHWLENTQYCPHGN